MQAVLAGLPEAKWVSWRARSTRDNTRAGAVLAFGEAVEPHYRFDQADVILCLEADFPVSDPASLRLPARLRARAARSNPERPEMNRLYVVESAPTLTGAIADHRLPLRGAQVEGFARAVAAALGVAGRRAPSPTPGSEPLAKDLKRAGARALVIAGETQPPAVHALAHAINEALGNAGSTVVYTAARGDRRSRARPTALADARRPT